MKRVGILPTLVTAANGYCGLLSVFKTHDGLYADAAFLILLAMVFDVLDGKVARMAGITSRFGAYLDSLSDAISFGVAPAFLAKAAVSRAWPELYSPKLLVVLTAVYALCALLRLARYNAEHASGEGSDSRGKEVTSFAGIPTPGAAGVIACVVFLAFDEHALLNYGYLVAGLPVLCALLGYVMVSRIRYVHFGARFLQGRRDFGYIAFLLVLIGLLTKFPHEVAAFGFFTYALSGPARGLLRRLRPGEEGEEVEAETEEEDEPEPANRIPDGL